MTRVIEDSTRSRTAASRITTVLAKHPGPWTTCDLAEQSRTSGTSFDLALALLAARGAVLSTRRLGVQAGPGLSSESPRARSAWAATFGAHLEPYLAELALDSAAVPVVAILVREGSLELARYEHGRLTASWGGTSSGLPAEGTAPIRILRGSLRLGAAQPLDAAQAAAQCRSAARIQAHLGRVYPLAPAPRWPRASP